MTPRPRVLVVQHEDDCPVAMIEPWLADVGLDCDVLAAHRGRAVPAHLVDHAGLIVLGGRMGAGDEARHRWLGPTKALIATVAAGGMPFLGVCLGHQLAAAALGGQVRPHAGPTRALHPLGATPEGLRDALLGGLGDGPEVLHWNDDVVVRAPAGATVLARTPDGAVQALRLGPRAWGVQFHPEVTGAVVRGWAADRDLSAQEEQVVGELERRTPELHRGWARLVRTFGRTVLGAGVPAGMGQSP
ncbi:type 1 glutamine amidotransferase [Ornithinimicrobium sp. W1679]|uniref:type 1 glutamine amidotransferase n=1 Tax=Ornithinimicrobium sp. W1679 TaxID=3418770 RepID=UPI003CF1F390